MAKKRNRTADAISYAFVRVLLFVFKWTPGLIIYPLLHGLGRLVFVFLRKHRVIALANLRLAFGDAPSDSELLGVASRALGSAFMVGADMAKVGRYIASGRFADCVDVSGCEHMREELARLGGRPPILCTPHLGSWEVGGLAIGTHFHGLNVIARPLGNPYLQRYIKETRSQTGQHIHPRRGGIRPVLQGLREGRAAGTLPDQNQRVRGIFVPVFGKLASCDRSQARLAQMSGSPIVVGAALRIGKRFRFRIVIADIFTVPAGSGDAGRQIVWDATARLHRSVEKLILEAPEQYFWVHNRYRTRPPEEKQARKKSA